MNAMRCMGFTAGALLAGLIMVTGCGDGDGGNSPSATSFTVSGVITAAEGSAIDGDVNHPLAPFSPNNVPSNAQPLDNPAVVGGFASAVGTGRQGDRFASAGDPSDVYRVTLVRGQVITLNISDHLADSPAAIDLDLGLFDTSNPPNMIEASLGTGSTESITVPTPSGEYFVWVRADKGFSNYTLTVGQSTTSGSVPALRLNDEFVPGEVVVRFRDTKQPAGSGAGTLQAPAQSIGLQAQAGDVGREMLFSLGDAAQQHQQAVAALDIKGHGVQKRWGAWRDGLTAMAAERRLKYETIQVVKALRGRADVATADLNYIRHALLAPNDQFYPLQWHYPLINLPQAWEVTTGDANVIVAVVDTGVVLGHPDLSSKLTATGFDFISDPNRANDGDGIDANAADPGDATTPGGSSFHGTHVAGTVSAASNNTTGVAGVSWQTRIMPVRVLGLGGTSNDYDFLQGVRYAAGLPNDSEIILPPAQRADIINLSLGSPSFSQTAQNVFTQVRNAGVIVVAAAGNKNTSAPTYPAAYDGVISVSAVDMQKRRAPYSNFGTTIDVAAPGGDSSIDRNGDGFVDGVLSTLAEDSGGTRTPIYNFNQGTSMAAPHMAGVVALMKAVHPALTPVELNAVLSAGAITEDLAANGPAARDNNFGFGLIDALKAVQVANSLASGAPLPAILDIDPAALDFGSTQTSLILTTSNAGEAPLNVTGVTDDQPWLIVTPTNVNASGLGTYTAVVDRTGLVNSTYTATITFTTDTAGTVRVPVAMRVGAGSVVGNTGFQFILLIDAQTLEPIARDEAGNVNGSYNYQITGVIAGDYLIVAGTDSDNDGLICDDGESCGGYPTLDLPQPITIGNSDVSGLDFISTFDVGFGAASFRAGRKPERGFSRLPGKRLGE